MFKSYLKTAIRNLKKNKTFSLVNILGLAIGVACFILITLFVIDELTYDSFNQNADRIFRANMHFKIGDNKLDLANTPGPLAGVLTSDYPEIIKAVRIVSVPDVYVKKNEDYFKEEKFFYADSTLFEIFSIEFLQGNPLTALRQPNSVVVTPEAAKKYFAAANPMNSEIILSDGKVLTVTGIVKPAPGNSHFEYDFIASFSTLPQSRKTEWFDNYVHTYVLTNSGVSAAVLNGKIYSVTKKHLDPIIKGVFGVGYDDFINKGSDLSFEFVPLEKIHLSSNVFNEFKITGDINTVYLFSAVAIFILLIACINFINLSTAKSSRRAGEIGIRKVLGSNKMMLIKQLLTESILLTSIAVIIAVILIEIALPFFNRLTEKSLSLNLTGNIFTIPALIVFAVILGIASGLYPAFVLVAPKPILTLKSKTAGSKTNRWLRKGLVVFQFATSIILFVGTFVIYSQMQYIKNKNLGFDQDRILIIKNLRDLGTRQFAFSDAVRENSDVINASLSEGLPDHQLSVNVLRKEGSNEENQTLVVIPVDYDFLKTYKMEMKEGRFFDENFTTDSSAIVLNETAVKRLNYSNPLNSKLLHNFGEGNNEAAYNVIGVVKDFHLQSLRDEIRPAAFVLLNQPVARFLSVKISSRDISGTIKSLSDKWKEFGQMKAMEYSFFDESFNDMYKSEIQSEKIFTVFALLAVIIACLGLFGLAAFTAEQKTKEIGVRKVLGASIADIVAMLSKEFMILVAVANIIAWPAAYFIMGEWLDKFVFKISIGVGIFVLSGLTVLVIALITVSFQSVKAATVNPVESLHYE